MSHPMQRPRVDAAVRAAFGVTAAVTLIGSGAIVLTNVQLLGSSDGWARVVGGMQLGFATFAFVMAAVAMLGILRFAHGSWWQMAAFYGGGVLAMFLLWLTLTPTERLPVALAVGTIVWGGATFALFLTTRLAGPTNG